jgi:hypothetical protein
MQKTLEMVLQLLCLSLRVVVLAKGLWLLLKVAFKNLALIDMLFVDRIGAFSSLVSCSMAQCSLLKVAINFITCFTN